MSDLELLLAAGVQRPLVEQLQVASVFVELALGFGLLCPGKALQQGGLERAHIPVERLRKRQM